MMMVDAICIARSTLKFHILIIICLLDDPVNVRWRVVTPDQNEQAFSQSESVSLTHSLRKGSPAQVGCNRNKDPPPQPLPLLPHRHSHPIR